MTLLPLDFSQFIEWVLVGVYLYLFMIIFLQGGIGDAVSEVVCDKRDIIVKKQCVREVPRSGPPMVLLEKFGIGTNCIIKAVEDMKDL